MAPTGRMSRSTVRKKVTQIKFVAPSPGQTICSFCGKNVVPARLLQHTKQHKKCQTFQREALPCNICTKKVNPLVLDFHFQYDAECIARKPFAHPCLYCSVPVHPDRLALHYSSYQNCRQIQLRIQAAQTSTIYGPIQGTTAASTGQALVNAAMAGNNPEPDLDLNLHRNNSDDNDSLPHFNEDNDEIMPDAVSTAVLFQPNQTSHAIPNLANTKQHNSTAATVPPHDHVGLDPHITQISTRDHLLFKEVVFTLSQSHQRRGNNDVPQSSDYEINDNDDISTWSEDEFPANGDAPDTEETEEVLNSWLQHQTHNLLPSSEQQQAEGEQYPISPMTTMACIPDSCRQAQAIRAVNVREEFRETWAQWAETKPCTETDKSLIQLLLMLEKRGCPHTMFREILEWANRSPTPGQVAAGNTTNKVYPLDRRSFLKKISRIFPPVAWTHTVVPIETVSTQTVIQGRVWFFSDSSRQEYDKLLQSFVRKERDFAQVHHTDFEAQLKDLLSDFSLFGNLDNLVVNKISEPLEPGNVLDAQKVFAPFEDNDHPLNEILSASWYKDTVRRMKLGPNDFLCPVIIYMDKTGTDAYQRYGLEPVIFTVAILKRKLRQLSRAWRPLGFIPDQELKSKAEKSRDRQNKMKGSSNRNYQYALRPILESLIRVQNTGFEHTLLLGPFAKVVRIWPKVCFVSGDGKSADTLCGRYGSHDKLVRRQCNSCWTMYNDLDMNPETPIMIKSYQMRFMTALCYRDSFLVNEDNVRENQGEGLATHIDDTDQDAYNGGSISCEESLDNRKPAAKPSGTMAAYLDEVSLLQQQTENDRLTKGKKTPVARARKRTAIRTPVAPRLDPDAALQPYKTIPHKADSLINDHPLLNHEYVFNLVNQWRVSQNQTLIEPGLDDSFNQSDLNYIWHLYQNRYVSQAESVSTMQLMGQHVSILAFDSIDFGGDGGGIHDATPVDVMHALKLGVAKYAAQLIIKLMKPSQHVIIDGMSHSILAAQKQTENRYYHRTDFSHSVTTLSMLTADEWVGVLFSLLIIFSFERGHATLDKRADVDANGVVYVIETILCGLHWMSRGPYWKPSDTVGRQMAQVALNNFAECLITELPRTEGNGWCISKLHKLVGHLVQLIDKYGSPANWDASTGERNLKTHAKLHARTAQMRGYRVFLSQVVSRCMEHSSIQKATDAWCDNRWEKYYMDNEEHEVTDGSNHLPTLSNTLPPNALGELLRYKLWSATIFLDVDKRTHRMIHPPSQSNENIPPKLVLEQIQSYLVSLASTALLSGHDDITDNMPEAILANINSSRVLCFQIIGYSEAILTGRLTDKDRPSCLETPRYDDIVKDGLLLRCHSNYRGTGARQDWIVYDRPNWTTPARSEDDEGSMLSGCPAKLHGIVEWKLVSLDQVSDIGLTVERALLVDYLESLQVLRSNDVHQYMTPNSLFIVHPCYEMKMHSVIIEDWSLEFERVPLQQIDENQEEGYLMRPLLDCISSKLIKDRCLAFTAKKLIHDNYRLGDLDELSTALVVRCRENHWSGRFVDCGSP